MAIPSRITIKTLKKVEDQLKEVEFDVPFEYNFNATNAYRKKYGIAYSDFVTRFQGLGEGNFDANEAVGELLHFAIKEGCRICYEDMPELSVEDVSRYINSDPAIFRSIIDIMAGDMDQGGEKKNQQEKESSPGTTSSK